jgi:hypothetical protein
LRRKRSRPEVKIENCPDFHGNLSFFDPPDSRPDQLRCALDAENLERLVKSIQALPATFRVTADLILLDERSLSVDR